LDMPPNPHRFRGLGILLMAFILLAGTDASSPMMPVGDAVPAAPAVPAKPQLDRTGRKRIGVASFYATRFAGRKMADGTPMRPQGDNAASITLPLGTTALVTNLETGRAAVVTIRDRGPYVTGRIVDLSPSTARKIGLERKEGLAKVEVAPIEVPLADGSIKLVADNAGPKGNKRSSDVWDN
jgi:rare lipoprotein A